MRYAVRCDLHAEHLVIIHSSLAVTLRTSLSLTAFFFFREWA
jgi:hypothetical protein